MTYDDTMTALAGAGIAVKYPGAKPGVCTSPYVVVQGFGTYPYAQSTHLGYTLMEIHCYAPVGNYPALLLLISLTVLLLQKTLKLKLSIAFIL